MTVQDRTQYVAYTLNGTDEDILNVDVPAGETWHVKQVRLWNDGTGGTTNQYQNFSIVRDDVSADNNGGYFSVLLKGSGNASETIQKTVDRYVKETEKLRFTTGPKTDGAQWNVVVVAHRVE